MCPNFFTALGFAVSRLVKDICAVEGVEIETIVERQR